MGKMSGSGSERQASDAASNMQLQTFQNAANRDGEFVELASYAPELTSRIWDNYLLQGEAFMLRAALGVLKWLSAQCVDQPLEEQLVILTHLHAQVPRPALLSLLQASPFCVYGLVNPGFFFIHA